MSAPEAVRTTVLIADDDALVRGVLRLALTRIGYTVVEAHDSIEALSSAINIDPGLVILDLHMPGMTARETIDALRHELPAVAILLLSGDSNPPPGVVGPLCAFARKPIELGFLIETVDNLLAMQRGA